MKKNIIIKDSSITITVSKEHLIFKSFNGDSVVGFRHIEALYLNKAIEIGMNECYKIMCHVPLYLIDEHGYILARLKEE